MQARSEMTFKVGDKAVYPAQGVAEVVNIEEKDIAGNRQSFYVLRILDTDRKKREGLVPESNDPATVRASLRRFLDRAWRRPATEAELAAFEKLIASEMKAGEKFRPAYLSALVAALTSKNFYYLHEGTAGQDRKLVSDWELASRLSYFLWSTMPDEELFNLAAKNQLTPNLDAQVRRMLKDPRADALTTNFAMQWLQLERLKTFAPDTKLFPGFDDRLRRAMLRETQLFIGEIFHEDRSVLDLVDADFTYVNEALSRHYGLTSGSGVTGKHVTVSLSPELVATVTTTPASPACAERSLSSIFT